MRKQSQQILIPFLTVILLSCSVDADSSSVEMAAGPSWTRHTIDNSSQGADGVKMGDLNGDDLPDLATGWEEGGLIRVALNPGPEKAREPWLAVTVGIVKSPEEAIFADLIGDDKLEVISATEGNSRSVYRHRFQGEPNAILDADQWHSDVFPTTAGKQQWMQAVSLDLDGICGPDLVLASKQDQATIGWLQAPADSEDLHQWEFHPLRPSGWIMSLLPHDMDGDGDPDIVFTDRKGPRAGAFWLENPGAENNQKHQEWPEHAIGALGREVMFADLGDLNGDGRLDIALAVKPADIIICHQKPTGAWDQSSLTLKQSQIGDAKAVKIADLNQDGLPDLIFSCENATGQREGLVWLEQQTDGPWRQHSLSGPEGVKFDLMQALDLDNDGDLDIITCEERENLGVIWYENPHQS